MGRGPRTKVEPSKIFELQCLRLQGLTVPEVASQLGLPSQTVSYHWKRFRKEFRCEGIADNGLGACFRAPAGLNDYIESVVIERYGSTKAATAQNIHTVLLGAYLEGPFAGHPYLKELKKWKSCNKSKLMVSAYNLYRKWEGKTQSCPFNVVNKTVERYIMKGDYVPKEGYERLSRPPIFRFTRQINKKRMLRSFKTLAEAQAMKALFQEAVDAGADPFAISNWEVSTRALTIE